MSWQLRRGLWLEVGYSFYNRAFWGFREVYERAWEAFLRQGIAETGSKVILLTDELAEEL
jgi:hypothetical protein